MAKKVKLSTDQMKAVMELLNISMDFADKILGFLKVTGLDKVKGCGISIGVVPSLRFTTKSVTFGELESDSGLIGMFKGVDEHGNKVELYPHCSPEYVRLFDKQNQGSGNPEGNHVEKELPPDGLWLSDFDDCDPVDSGVQMNDMAITG